MAKKKQPAKPTPSPPKPEIIEPSADLVDLGGMTPEQYHRAVVDGVQDVLGQADIQTVGAVLDESLAEYLQVVDAHLGEHASRDAAINFARTCLPYAVRGLPEPEPKTYAQLRLKKEG